MDQDDRAPVARAAFDHLEVAAGEAEDPAARFGHLGRLVSLSTTSALSTSSTASATTTPIAIFQPLAWRSLP